METEINIVVTEERKNEMTLDNDIALEDMIHGRDPGIRAIRDLVAVFVADDNGKYLPSDQACELLGKVKNKNFTSQITEPFAEAFKTSMVPLPSAASSSQQAPGEAAHGG